ncbi:hypothetical protein [Candidatus Poriferisodalis sp.]|uniref:hypothetical protein n=1 Tax=Candidatus Poriferisodalis sp. TaxID=3101277 RepID=UPI003B02E91E
MQQLASERGWQVRIAECVKLASDGGRRINLLQRRTADELYASMHRGPVAVLHDAKPSPRIRIDPRRQLNDKRTRSLDEFCRYKSFVMSLRIPAAQGWATHFEDWLDAIECGDSNDPRVLPSHIFVAKDSYDLDEQSERRRFRDDHWKRDALQDKRRRRWRVPRPGQRHSLESQLVRQQPLPDGFHWDVTMPSSGSPLLMSTTAVWRVTQGGYINVHPNGRFRRGKNCSQIWSEEESDREDARDAKRSGS